MKTSPRAAASKQPLSIFAGLRHTLQQWPVLFSALILLTFTIVFTLWRSASAQSALNITTVAGSGGGTGLVAEF